MNLEIRIIDKTCMEEDVIKRITRDVSRVPQLGEEVMVYEKDDEKKVIGIVENVRSFYDSNIGDCNEMYTVTCRLEKMWYEDMNRHIDKKFRSLQDDVAHNIALNIKYNFKTSDEITTITIDENEYKLLDIDLLKSILSFKHGLEIKGDVAWAIRDKGVYVDGFMKIETTSEKLERIEKEKNEVIEW